MFTHLQQITIKTNFRQCCTHHYPIFFSFLLKFKELYKYIIIFISQDINIDIYIQPNEVSIPVYLMRDRFSEDWSDVGQQEHHYLEWLCIEQFRAQARMWVHMAWALLCGKKIWEKLIFFHYIHILTVHSIFLLYFIDNTMLLLYIISDK